MSEPFDIDSADKDDLEAFARTLTPPRELDKRKKLETLRAEVLAAADGSLVRHEKAEAAKVQEVLYRQTATPKRVRHRSNGFEFDWHPLFKGNADLEVIEWE